MYFNQTSENIATDKIYGAKLIEFDNKSNGISPLPPKQILKQYIHKLCAETLRLHGYLVGTRLFDYTVI